MQISAVTHNSCHLLRPTHKHMYVYTVSSFASTIQQKTLAVKSLAKRLLQRIGRKKIGECWFAAPIANHWLTVKQSRKSVRTNQFQTSINIIKQTPYFSGFVLCHMLVACHSMMARRIVECMIRGYHKYIRKLSLESELNLLKYCNIDILTSILTQSKLKLTSHCCKRLMLHTKNGKLVKKSWQIVVIHKICQSFFPSKVFTVRYTLK